MATKKSKRGYLWVTLALFMISIVGHWIFAWYAYVDEAKEHNQPVQTSEYVVQTARDTLENWQSEFLQLIWQVVGLALLWYVGSPSSKSGDDGKEAKLDLILKRLDAENAEKLLKALEREYPKN